MNLDSSLCDNFSNSKKLDVDVLKTIESYFCIKLPEFYRRFLLEINGGIPMKNIFYYNPQKKLRSSIECLYGIRSEKELNFLTNNSLMSNRIPQNMQIIGEDIVTNKILMSVKGKDYGKIYYWDHEMEAGEGEKPDYSNLTLIADSFEEFINSLKSEEEVDSIGS